MPNWLRRRFGRRSEAANDKPSKAAMNRAIQLQRAYWTHDPDEKAALLGRYPDYLSWAEVLRLHHLNCLELFADAEGKAQMRGDRQARVVAPGRGGYDLCRELTQRLLAQESPYRMRHCAVWQVQAGQPDQRPPDLHGVLRNASLTHLGCLEVIRLDDRNQPEELLFIPLDDVRAVLFGPPGLLRAAQVLYEDSREEIVYAPLIYGVSWLTDKQHDRDGTMTRFCCQLRIERPDMRIGIGIGHQDYSLATPEGKGCLLGLGSIGRIAVGLEIDDPRFGQKCRARGLDPSSVRQQMAGR